jgi:putative ABC transport system permease protein
MKFLPLLLANLGRKKVRTVLTLGSFTVALFLFGLLVAIRAAFSQGVEVAGADRLMITNRTSIIQPLPFAYRDRIARLPGVTEVTYANWFGGVYKDEKNFFPQFAVDHETYRQMYPEFVIPDEQWQAFLADRTGCVAGEATARRFGWKVGDRIPINGTIFPGSWEFNLRAIYKGSRKQDDTTQFWFRHDYLEEKAPPWAKGLVGWYTIRIANADDSPQVAKAIDERFSNSAWETRTMSEKAMASTFAKMQGNVEFLLLSVGAIVFFTLLLVTGNTMAIAVRERTSELAVLKAVGFSDRFLLVFVLLESLLIAAVGGALGLALAELVAWVNPMAAMLPFFYISAAALVVGLVLTAVVGMVSGLIPALTASRLRVSDAMRRI